MKSAYFKKINERSNVLNCEGHTIVVSTHFRYRMCSSIENCPDLECQCQGHH